jgi:hypothetical protein
MRTYIVLVFTLAAVLVTGCKKESSPDATTTATVNTAPLDNSFKTADPAVQANVSSVKNDVRYGTYDKALADLQKLAATPNLTPEQQKAIKDVTGQVQQALTSAAKGLTSGADKTAKDLQNSLPK